MYAMRFPDEETQNLTMQQLRGREGARVRRVYREAATEYGVEWTGRSYNPLDFSGSDPINQALSAAHACLYGLVHAAIVSLGCSPALGFVHTGHELSFVYDIADLYKADLSIPIAFEVVGEMQGTWTSPEEFPEEPDWDDLPGVVRRRVRDSLKDQRLLVRCVRDIKRLLLPENQAELDEDLADVIQLWDGGSRRVAAGRSYAEFDGEVDF